MPQHESKAASAGTEAHKRLEVYFRDYMSYTIDNPPQINVDGLENMTAYRVINYAKKAIEAALMHDGIKSCFPEYESSFDFGLFWLIGHVDLLIECNDGTTLVFDWKFGHLDVATAGDNIQTLGYACTVFAPHDVEVYLFNTSFKHQILKNYEKKLRNSWKKPLKMKLFQILGSRVREIL
jgi:hypothetical protein